MNTEEELDKNNFDICQQCFNEFQLPVCDCQSKPIDKKEFDDVLEKAIDEINKGGF
jgi:hypothetical protein